MPFELTIAGGSGRGRRFRFGAVDVTIGRAPENDLLLVEPGVSRCHARIRAEGPGHVLVDEGSRNGTALNGTPIRGAVALSHGDRIGIGPVLFEYAPGGRRLLRRRFGAAPWWAQIFVACSTASCLLLAASTTVRGQDPGKPATSQTSLASIGPSDPGAADFTSAPTTARAEEALRWYERGRRKLEERRVAPRNLYEAWKSFGNARRLLDGHDLPPPLDALPRLVGEAERDLERDCRNLLFAARRFAQYGQEQKAQAAYREVLLHFPGEDPSGCRERAQQELSADGPGEEGAG
jgi:hypothetical protein